MGGDRWCEFGDAVSGWSARPFAGLCGGDLVGRRRRSGLVRARAGLAAVGVDRGAVVRAVPVALADLRRAQCGADGARRVDAARRAHRGVRCVRLHLVPAGRGPGAAPRQVGSRPLRCGRARRHRRRRGRADRRAARSHRPGRRVRCVRHRRRRAGRRQRSRQRAGRHAGDRHRRTGPATSQPTRSADRSEAPAAASAPARPDSAATGPARTVPARTVPATTVAVPLQEIHSVMWTGDSVSFDLAPGVVRVVDRGRPRCRRVSGRTTDCGWSPTRSTTTSRRSSRSGPPRSGRRSC